jgi:hypothetical protein
MVPSGALPKSIRKFLDSCDSEPKIERCQDGGFLMEPKVATFTCVKYDMGNTHACMSEV